MVRALVTGVTGFAGSHLAEFLLGNNVEVFGTGRWRSKTENIDHLRDDITLVEADLKDLSSMINVVKKVEPDIIFHLAAQSFVPTSWHAPHQTLTVNVLGTLNLFEAVRKTDLDAKIQIAGSSEEYGLVRPEETPITEDNPLRPLSPYGVSKVATDMLGYQYFQSYGMKIVRTRAFNHTGPRRGDVFVSSNFAKQIAEIEAGAKPEMKVGNLSAYRDFTDVRDVVKAYYLSLQKCEFGDVYNICSGETRTIQSVLDLLLSMSKKKISVKKDPERMRPSDVEILHGDCSKFRNKTGWTPEIPFEKTMADLLEYWRQRV
ncbi:MAG: GDP-mannose 4,6-dehydratase [Candidatus Altiarchaeota archaeon]|nr:GDP-mannose 4,6-dehydratase [Candidatus Altiarchaeota archaeon]